MRDPHTESFSALHGVLFLKGFLQLVVVFVGLSLKVILFFILGGHFLKLPDKTLGHFSIRPSAATNE